MSYMIFRCIYIYIYMQGSAVYNDVCMCVCVSVRPGYIILLPYLLSSKKPLGLQHV